MHMATAAQQGPEAAHGQKEPGALAGLAAAVGLLDFVLLQITARLISS